MKFLISILMVIQLGCASSSKISEKKKPNSPEQTAIKIHRRNNRFIDLEAPKDQVWVACSDEDVEDDISFLGFNVLDGQNGFMFFYRRPLSIKQCRDQENEYLALTKDAQTIRIVGLHQSEEDGPDPRDERIPERFTNVKKMTSSFFVRLQTEKGCKAYFREHCDLPKNYWGGTIPEK